ncbi:MAG: Hpt domain-containing protein [Nitrosospira sp.]
MMNKNDELLKKLLATFGVEADAHLQTMSSGLLALGKIPAEGPWADIVETIFRDAHSLKGAARAVSLTQVEAVCQCLESVFSALKDQRLAVSPLLVDLLLQTTDALGGLLDDADKGGSGKQKPRVGMLIRQLEKILKEPPPASADPAAPPPQAAMPGPILAPSPPAPLPSPMRSPNWVPALPARTSHLPLPTWHRSWSGYRP